MGKRVNSRKSQVPRPSASSNCGCGCLPIPKK